MQVKLTSATPTFTVCAVTPTPSAEDDDPGLELALAGALNDASMTAPENTTIIPTQDQRRRTASPYYRQASPAMKYDMTLKSLRFATYGMSLVLVAMPVGSRTGTHLTSQTSTHLSWMGHVWTVTNGGMAGVARGRPSNVYLDSSGYLHLTITKKHRTETAGELFSNDKMGFGTYQWVVQGPVDNMDPHTVLGLFPYGPAAGVGRDGENEIDIEFSKWGNTLCGGACNADFTIYPSTGNFKTGPTEDDFNVNLNGGDVVTARMTWSSTSITETVMSGSQPLGTTQDVLHTWTFAPSDYLVRIPQQPVPVGMNLWCFKKKTASSQAVVIQSFQYLAQ
jgi:hypothetical protein